MANKAALNRTIQLQEQMIAEQKKVINELSRTECESCTAKRRKRLDEMMEGLNALSDAIKETYKSPY